jgi:hypothetical protein
MARLPANQQNLEEQGLAPKPIFIAIAGSGQLPMEVNLEPGTTPFDVLEQLNLSDYRLKKPGGSFFALGDDLYTAVDKGQKLYASPDDVEAGATSDAAGARSTGTV